MKQTSIILCAALVVAMLAVGCAKPPTEEMNNATEAVTRAENNQDAVTYAGSSVARARDALAKMNSEAASKRYDAARSYAAEAITAAERAIADGRAGAERARNDASSLVSQLKPLIEETEQGINAARAADLPLDFDSIDAEFNTARRDADQAQVALSAGRYGDAMDRGRAARLGLNGINQQLSIASMSVTRKK
jgi:S-formylglutathione hydrolase FrmB